MIGINPNRPLDIEGTNMVPLSISVIYFFLT